MEKFNFFSTIFYLQNYLFAIFIILFNRKYNKSAIYYALLIIVFTTYNIEESIRLFGGSIYLYALIQKNATPFYFLQGPFLYFFVRGVVTRNPKLSKKDFFHFIPFLIVFVQIIPYLISSFDYKLEQARFVYRNVLVYYSHDWGFLYPSIYNYIFCTFSFFIYSFFSIKLLRRNKKLYSQDSCEVAKVFRWLFFISYLILVLSCLVFISWLLLSFIDNESIKLIFFEVMLKVMIFVFIFTTITVIAYPRVLLGLPEIYKEESSNNTEAISTNCGRATAKINCKTDSVNLDKFSHSDLIAYEEIAIQFKQYMDEKKPYLREDFSVRDVSVDLNVPRHKLQFTIANILNSTFSDVKNQYRINYAIELLRNEKNEKISLEGIGKLSGFASNTNFYKSFQKITGLTPKRWLDFNKNK